MASLAHRCQARWMLRAFLVTALLALVGCSAPPPNVTADFWQAIADGDLETAADLSNEQDLRRLARLVERHPIGSIEIGEVRTEGDAATVQTRLHREGEPLVFETHLRRGDSGWQVDVGTSTLAVRRALLESSVAELRGVFEDGADALGEAAQQGLDEATKAIREALGELEAGAAPPVEP